MFMLPVSTAEGKSRCNGKYSSSAQPAKAKATATAKGPMMSGTSAPRGFAFSYPEMTLMLRKTG